MSKVNWHGYDAWQMENDQVRVVIVPALGAKIASLVDKASGFEWLAAPTRPVRMRTYGDTFTDHDLSGWDEMFPTIVACPSPHDAAVMLPDHGEVWALPWEVVGRGDHALTLRVRGVGLDYNLIRKATLQAAGMRLDYTLENLTGQPLPFLWAAHPLFNADEETVFELPAEINRVVNVMEHPVWGAPDSALAWPEDKRGVLNRVGSASNQDCRKVYTSPEQPVASACLLQARIDRRLCMRWDSGSAPYLGIWVDEGTYTRTTTVALEPSSGYYDSLALAQQNGRVAMIPAGETLRWWVEVQVGP